MKHKKILFILFFSLPLMAKPIVFSGRVLTSANLAIENNQTKFNVKIVNASTCVLYEEEFTIDMTATNGYFKLSLSGGSPQFNLNGLDLFRSRPHFCKDGSSWNAGLNDIRRAFISVKVGDDPWVNFASDTINSVAYANEAESIGGKFASDLIQSSPVTTQLKVDQILTQHQNILDLVTGNNFIYAKQNLVEIALSNKQNILSYSPINPANNLSELTNTVAARSNLGLGSVATKSSLTDADISSINWSKINGEPAAFTPLPHIHSISDITNISSTLNSKVDKVDFTCNSSQILTYISISDTFSCVEITVSGDVIGNLGVTTVSKIQGKQVSPVNPQNGDVLTYNSTNSRWEPTASSNSGAVPSSYAGEIITFPGDCPTGTVIADGQSLDQSANIELFNAYGCTFGCPNPSVSFKIPDYRGYFLRMSDNGAGVDSGRNINTTQNDEFKSHNHGGGYHDHGGGNHSHAFNRPVGDDTNSPRNIFDMFVAADNALWTSTSHTGNSGNIINPQSVINLEGGGETRPKNQSVNYCIRLKNIF